MCSEAMQPHKSMASCQVIANYERLAALTGRMRAEAVQGEWERLADIERQCSELVAAMTTLDATAQLDAAARQEKNRLIAGIMADDAEIRRLIAAWMGRLQHNLQSSRQEQLLLKAYGV